jgi:hypothetical protein
VECNKPHELAILVSVSLQLNVAALRSAMYVCWYVGRPGQMFTKRGWQFTYDTAPCLPMCSWQAHSLLTQLSSHMRAARCSLLTTRYSLLATRYSMLGPSITSSTFNNTTKHQRRQQPASPRAHLVLNQTQDATFNVGDNHQELAQHSTGHARVLCKLSVYRYV